MRRLVHATLTLAALAVWTLPAWSADEEKLMAQQEAVQVLLLRQKSVQHDLKLSEAEAQKAHDFAAQQWKKVQEVKGLSAAQRDQKYEAMAQENEKFLETNLKPEQRKRLDQITMQVAGLLWALRPSVASELKLSDEQKQKLKKIHEEARRDAHQALNADSGAVKEEKIHELRMANRKRLMSVLTDEQKAKWKEMAGRPFEGKLHFESTGTKR